MSRNKKELWTLENGEDFTINGKHYTYVGRYNTGCRFRCFAIDDVTLNIVEFAGNTELYTKKVKKRDNFWYKKKFLELIFRHIEPDRVEVRFSDICSRLFTIINKDGSGVIDELGGRYNRCDDYKITVDYKYWKGITIMLINTVTGKSVAVKHINPEKVTTDNIHLILFELYKKYMNQ